VICLVIIEGGSLFAPQCYVSVFCPPGAFPGLLWNAPDAANTFTSLFLPPRNPSLSLSSLFFFDHFLAGCVYLRCLVLFVFLPCLVVRSLGILMFFYVALGRSSCVPFFCSSSTSPRFWEVGRGFEFSNCLAVEELRRILLVLVVGEEWSFLARLAPPHL